jgi:flagellar M-ring protein FliF
VALNVDPKAVILNLFEGYLKLPLTQKVLFPLLVVFSISAVVYVSKMATDPDYTVLYSDLSTADAAGVVERLKELKIAYKIEGSTISIKPPEQVHELRMSLAAEGLPKSGTVGFELFDGTNFATTTMGEMVKKLRATQGELERTIMSLDSVVSARVHISQPEKSVFAKQGQEPAASVLLKLRPGGELEKKQIKGIANFVAGSVEGLRPENVTIIDVYGNLLTPKDEEGEGLGADATRLQYTREVEKGYVQRIEQMLARVLGPGKVVARVTADIDFSANERQEESYDPGGQVLRSERHIEEGTGASQRGGVPGVVSNLTNDPKLLSPPEAGSEQSARKESVKNFEVSRAVVKSSQARGKVLRVSAAVLVDGLAAESAEGAPDGKGDAKGEAKPAAKTFKALPPEMLTQVESVVKSAIGFDATRGDVVTVENVPFFEPDESLKQELEKADQMNMIFRGVSMAVPILCVLLFFLVFVRPMVKFMLTPTEAELDLSRLLPTGLQELEAEIDAERSKTVIPEFEPAVDLEQLGELMSENSRLVKENPQQAALLIRYWLNDGRL